MRRASTAVAVALLALVGLALQDERVFGHVRAVVERATTLTRAADGRFYVMGRVNGAPVRFLVDPDASDVALAPADARRLGIDTAALRYDRPFETPFGIGHGARFVARSLAVGDARIPHERMWVNRDPMPASMLGLVFLKGLASYQLQGQRLDLLWKPWSTRLGAR